MNLRVLTLLTLMIAGCGPEPEPLSPEGLSAEEQLDELHVVVRTLAEENRQLKARLAELEAGRAAPLPPPPPPTQRASAAGEVAAPPQNGESLATVLYVNAHWHYLVVDRGGEQGLAEGQEIRITREGRPVASARITALKPRQAVAEVLVSSLGGSGVYPRPRDRVELP